MLRSIKYNLVEIFQSRQGEGAQTGRSMTFVRLAGCNLKCPWCDTDRKVHFQKTLRQLLLSIPFDPNSVLITGGEPTLQNIKPLAKTLREGNYWVGLETNGTNSLKEIRPYFNYITVSPKIGAKLMPEIRVEEVRVAVDESVTADLLEWYRKTINAKRYYLSPIEIGGKFFLKETMELLGKVNKKRIQWLLSLQTHKILGIK